MIPRPARIPIPAMMVTFCIAFLTASTWYGRSWLSGSCMVAWLVVDQVACELCCDLDDEVDYAEAYDAAYGDAAEDEPSDSFQEVGVEVWTHVDFWVQLG